MRELKTAITLFLLLSASLTVNAQLKDWVNKQKQKLQQNEHVQRASRSVQQVDPKVYLKRKINENYQIQKYINNINYKFSQLENTISNNSTFYKSTENTFGSELKTTTNSAAYLAYLEDGAVNLYYPVKIIDNNKPYDLYFNNNYYVAVSDNSMPLDANLQNIITTALWTTQTKNVNTAYLNNLENLTAYTSDFSGYILIFCDQVILILDALEDMEYMGYSAADAVDMYAKMHGYNFSVYQANEGFKTMRSDFHNIQTMAGEISSGCENFADARLNVIRTKTSAFPEAQSSLKEFTVIASNLNSLADAVARKKQQAIDQQSELVQLSNFSGIEFIEDIGDLFAYLINYYQILEDGIRAHANNFSGFVSNVNTESQNHYANSKSSIDKLALKQLSTEIPYIQEYIDIFSDITSSEYKNLPASKFTAYLGRVKELNDRINKERTVDFIEFHNIKGQTRELYNDFPIEMATAYYKRVLELIDDKQIIGGNYYETYMSQFNSILDKIQSDKSAVKELKKSSRELDGLYDQAKSNNTTFYIILGIFCLLVIGIIGALVLRRKRKKSKQ